MIYELIMKYFTNGIDAFLFYLWANLSITMGSHVKIGGDCILMDSDEYSLDYRIR